MPDPKNRLFRVGDWELDVQIPNPALQAWLNGPEAKAAIEKLTRQVYVAYVNALPEITSTLKKGAKPGVGRRKYPGQSERYYGWVINSALSYRPREGEPYPRFIEYGKKNADGSRTKAGHHLLRAAYEVARARGVPAAQLAGLTSQLEANPALHQARPAKKRKSKRQRREENRRMREENRKGYLRTEEEKKAGYKESDGLKAGQSLRETAYERKARLRREQEAAARARQEAFRKRIAENQRNK